MVSRFAVAVVAAVGLTLGLAADVSAQGPGGRCGPCCSPGQMGSRMQSPQMGMQQMQAYNQQMQMQANYQQMQALRQRAMQQQQLQGQPAQTTLNASYNKR